MGFYRGLVKLTAFLRPSSREMTFGGEPISENCSCTGSDRYCSLVDSIPGGPEGGGETWQKGGPPPAKAKVVDLP